MPNIKSSKKRAKVGERNKARNFSQKSAMRTAIRAVREAIEAGNKEDALAKLPAAFSKIDKAIKRKIIHRNAGARFKKRMTSRLQALG